MKSPCVGPTIFRAGQRTQISPGLPLPRRFEGEPGSLRDGRVPSLVLPVLPRFPGLDRAVIIAIFEHIFRPKKDLIKLRSPEFKASALDGESLGLKSKTQMLHRFCCNIFTAFHTYLSISRTIRP